MKKRTITSSIQRIAIWNAAGMLGLYFTFSIFTLIILNFILIDDIDSKLRHELEHIAHSIVGQADSIHIIHPRELEEHDLMMVSDDPFFLQIYDLEGNIYLQSANLNNYHQILLGFPNNFDPYYYEDFYIEETRLRTIYKAVKNESGNQIGYYQLSAFHSSFNRVLKSVFWFNVIALPIVVIGIIFLSIFLAKKSYNPINKIISLAETISAKNLSERLEYKAEPEDELGRLKITLNSLFDRLETQIKEISQFTDNASHQLMTPLTTIKTELDFIQKRERTTKEYEETLGVLHVQTDRMINMVKTMLIMSRGETNNSKVFNLSHLLQNELLNFYKDKNVKFEIEKDIYLRGNSEYVSIAVQNLVNNARKYSEKKEVLVELRKQNGLAKLKVYDQGIGISNEEKGKIFQRFYRVDIDSVSRVSGYGLGLSLVESVIKSMNGEINIYDNIPTGSIFELSIPIIEFN